MVVRQVWNHADPGNILKQFDGYSGAAGNGIYFYETQPNAETLWGPRWNYPSQGVTEYIIGTPLQADHTTVCYTTLHTPPLCHSSRVS